MPQKPFNELLLWKGQIQKNQRSSKVNKPDMVLPKYNTLTGKYVPESPSIHDELLYRYSVYSAEYWSDIKEKHKIYRLKNQLS